MWRVKVSAAVLGAIFVAYALRLAWARTARSAMSVFRWSISYLTPLRPGERAQQELDDAGLWSVPGRPRAASGHGSSSSACRP
jgi:hypothetical protein